MARQMERRSSRQKKTVNYRQILEVNSGESDDDFAGPPAPKKTRNKAPGNSLDQPSTTPQTKSIRLSREETNYHRAIQQAMKDSQTGSDTTTPVLSEVSNVSNTVHHDKEDKEFLPDNEEAISSEEEGVSDENDDSDLNLPPPAKLKVVRNRQTKKNINQNSNGIDKSNEPLPKSSKSPTTVTTNSVTTTTKETIVPEVNLTSRKTVLEKTKGPLTPKSHKTSVGASTPISCQPSTSSVTRSTPTVGTGRKFPKWTPPSRVGEGAALTKTPVTVNSNGTPVIRIGLSRHARIKPLHISKT